MTNDPKRRRIRARVTNDVVTYIHQEISMAAFLVKQRLQEMPETDHTREAMFVDVVTLVTMVAFALEGYVNFIGERLIYRDGKSEISSLAWAAFEQMRVREKVEQILRLTDGKADWGKRPYGTIIDLVKLRNTLAHPKSHRPKQIEYEATGTPDEIMSKLRDYRPDHNKHLTRSFALMAWSDVDEIWGQLLELAGIEAHETWGGGSQTIEYIEDVTDD